MTGKGHLAKLLGLREARQLMKTGVGVEKRTKGVISINLSFCGGRTFNNLRANSSQTSDQKEFFNSHTLRSEPIGYECNDSITMSAPTPG
jgi:hypothetical protein